MTNKAKTLTLKNADRENVRDVVINALIKKIKADREKVHAALEEEAYADIFSPEQRIALNGCLKPFTSVGTPTYFTLYVRNQERFVYFDFKKCRFANTHARHEISEAVFIKIQKMYVDFGIQNASRAADMGLRGKEVENIERELNSVLISAKTRGQLAELWPPVVDLMGLEWLNETKPMSTLPAIITTNLDAAVKTILKEAA